MKNEFRVGHRYYNQITKDDVYVLERTDRLLFYRSMNRDRYYSGTAVIERNTCGVEFIKIHTGGDIESIFIAK